MRERLGLEKELKKLQKKQEKKVRACAYVCVCAHARQMARVHLVVLAGDVPRGDARRRRKGG